MQIGCSVFIVGFVFDSSTCLRCCVGAHQQGEAEFSGAAPAGMVDITSVSPSLLYLHPFPRVLIKVIALLSSSPCADRIRPAQAVQLVMNYAGPCKRHAVLLLTGCRFNCFIICESARTSNCTVQVSIRQTQIILGNTAITLGAIYISTSVTHR